MPGVIIGYLSKYFIYSAQQSYNIGVAVELALEHIPSKSPLPRLLKKCSYFIIQFNSHNEIKSISTHT